MPLRVRLFAALFVVMCLCSMQGRASVVVQPSDSVLVEKLLREAQNDGAGECLTLYFGKKLLGVPYVAHTLEVGQNEQLVVNLRQLDCTTYVETVCALSLCHAHGKTTFHDFCHYLQQLRYEQGRIAGYPSRLHYFTQWGTDNERMGLVESVFEQVDDYPFSTYTVQLNYMSTHPDAYRQLKQQPALVPVIRQKEKEASGRAYRYLPKAQLNRSQRQLPFVHTGDIVAIVTSKAGLDTSHLGFAVWQGGRLHLMHASSLKKKVILDPSTFYDYSQGQRSQIGIRVFRLKAK